MPEDMVTRELRRTFRDPALDFEPRQDLVSGAKAQAGRGRRGRVLVSSIGMACAVAVVATMLPRPGSGSARDSVIEALSARSNVVHSVWYHESLVELLPNTKFQAGNAPGRALSESVVVGRFVAVERGRAFFTAGDEDPRPSAEEFDDPRVQWRTVHADLEVEQTIAGKQMDRVTVGFSFVGRSPALDEIDKGLQEFGRVLLFLTKSPAFDYDPAVFGTVENGNLVGLVDDDGKITLPLAEGREGQLLRGASTTEQLIEAAAQPERAIRIGRDSKRETDPHTRKRPHYLPPGVHLVFEGSRPDYAEVLMSTYAIDGRANADTRAPSREGVPPLEEHQATTIQLTQEPGTTVDPALDPRLLDISVVNINGAEARLTQPRENSYGAIRIDWTDGEFSFLLMVPRWNVGGDGISGVPANELIKMARSIR